MKVAVEPESIVHVLSAVARAASSRGPINVLAGIRLAALDDRVVIAATDMDLSIRAAIPARVDEEGVVVVPARTFVDLVRKLPPGRLSLEASEDHVLQLASGEAGYRLNALPAVDFPELPAPVAGPTVAIDRRTLLGAFARVERAASRDASRPLYTGVLVGIDEGHLTMVAMDGHRLAVSRSDVAVFDVLEPTLIPARAFAELARLPIEDDTIDLMVGENVVAFETGGYRLTIRRLNGQFQPYEALLGAEFAHEVAVDRKLLLDAIDRASVFVQRNSPIVLDFHEDALLLRVTTAELGDAVERLPLADEGSPITVAFNSGYLLDGLQVVGGNDVLFRMSDPLRPVVLRGDQSDTTYLVAPVRRP